MIESSTTSWASSPAVRKSMLANRRRDTALELQIRRLLHARGLRYRVDARVEKDIRSHADIVFTRRRIVVFIDGCFWHRCPIHASSPKTNSDYWERKLSRNQQRDAEVTVSLAERDWRVLRFWEHENPIEVVDVIAGAWLDWAEDRRDAD